MKQILTIAFMLAASALFAQDTTGVMITLDEVIYLDYQDELNIISIEKIKRRDRNTKRHKFHVDANEVLALHLYDNRFNATRAVSTIFLDDNDRGYFEVSSNDNILYSPCGYGPLIVEVSEPNFTVIMNKELEEAHQKACDNIECK